MEPLRLLGAASRMSFVSISVRFRRRETRTSKVNGQVIRAFIEWIHRFFFLGVIVALCVLFFVFFAPMFISDGRIKRSVQERFRDRVGLELSVEGGASVAFFPSPTVTLRGVNVLPGEGGVLDRQLISVREAVVKIGFVPFFLGRNEIDRITLRAPTFYVKRMDLSAYDWDAFVQEAADGKPSGQLKEQGVSADMLWRILYGLCGAARQGTPLDQWREANRRGAARMATAERKEPAHLSTLMGALCRNAPADRLVRFNWEMPALTKDVGDDRLPEKGIASAGDFAGLADAIDVKDGSVVYDAFDKEYRHDMISAEIVPGGGLAPFSVRGSVQGSRMPVEYGMEIGGFVQGAQMSAFVRAAEVFRIEMNGKVEADSNGALRLAAALEGKIERLSELSSVFEKDSIPGGLMYEGGAELKGRLAAGRNGVSLEEITIDSDAFKGKGKIGLDYVADRESDVRWKAELDVGLLDLDKLYTPPAASEEEDEGDYDASPTLGERFKLEMPDLYTLSATVNIGKVVYRQEEVKDFLLDLDVFRDRAILHRLEFAMPGNSVLTFSGQVEHNGVRPLFRGNIVASGDKLRDVAVWALPEYMRQTPEDSLNDYSFSAKLQMTPVSLMLDDVLLSFDNASLRGSYGVDYVDATSAINMSVYADRVDFDRYRLTPMILRGMRKINATSFGSGSGLEAYIRNLSRQMHFVGRGEDVVFNGYNLRHADLLFSYAPGKFDVDKFMLEDDEGAEHKQIDLTASMSLRVSEDGKPAMDISVQSKHFNLDILRHADAEGADGKDWRKEDIRYLFFDRFNGDMLFSFENVYLGEAPFAKNIYVKCNTKDKIMTADDVRMIFADDAKLVARGIFSLAPVVSAGVSFSGYRFDVKQLQELFLPAAEASYTGKLSAEGTWQADGATFEQMMKKLDVNGSFRLEDFVVSGVDLYKIFYAANNTISVVDMKQVIEQGLRTGETRFTKAKGTFATDKAQEPYIVRFKDVALSTPYSQSVLAANYSPLSNSLSSVFRFIFRPEEKKILSLILSSSGALGQKPDLKVDDKEIIAYITSKTEGLK
jgi:hypothetical protein